MLKTFTIKAVPRTEAYDDFPVLVRVTGPLKCTESLRPCLDLVAVLDVTGSMCGTKMEAMKQAMAFVIHHLDSNDRLAIVTYHNRSSNTLAQLTAMNDEGRAGLRNIINKISCYGGDAGMDQALDDAAKILRDRGDGDKENRLGSIIFLSDGAGSGCSRYWWCNEFPVHAIGFGRDHEPQLLSSIADKTSGTYWYVADAGNIVDALALFIGGIMSVTAMKILINVQTHEGVTISSIESGSHYSRIENHRQSCTVKIDNLYAGEEKNFIVRLTVPEGTEELMTVDGEYKNPKVSSMAISLTHSHVFVQRHHQGSSDERDDPKAAAADESGFWRWIYKVTKKTSVRSHVPCWTGPCPEVEVELTRLRVVRDVDCFLSRQEGHKLEQLLHQIENAKAKLSTSETSLSNIKKEVTEMQKYSWNLMHPYVLAWLSSHKWQRETTKSSPSSSGIFRTSEMDKMLQKAIEQKNARVLEI